MHRQLMGACRPAPGATNIPGLGDIGVAHEPLLLSGPGLFQRPGRSKAALKMRRQKGNTTLGVRGPLVIRLRGCIPHPASYSETPRTLAGHRKKVRLDRGLLQKDAAQAIGCSPLTFLHWKKGRVAPDVRSAQIIHGVLTL